MSMIGNYLMVDKEVVDKLQSGELTFDDVFYDDEEDFEDGVFLDVDKAWHAINFILTGEMDEGDGKNILSKVVLGGMPVNEEDVGYGPAQFITAKEAKAAAVELSKLTRDEARERCIIKDMKENDIYPVVEDEDEDEFFDYVWDYLSALQEFFRSAADQGKYILFFIS